MNIIIYSVSIKLYIYVCQLYCSTFFQKTLNKVWSHFMHVFFERLQHILYYLKTSAALLENIFIMCVEKLVVHSTAKIWHKSNPEEHVV